MAIPEKINPDAPAKKPNNIVIGIKDKIKILLKGETNGKYPNLNIIKGKTANCADKVVAKTPRQFKKLF